MIDIFKKENIKFTISFAVLISLIIGCSFLEEKFSEVKKEVDKEEVYS